MKAFKILIVVLLVAAVVLSAAAGADLTALAIVAVVATFTLVENRGV